MCPKKRAKRPEQEFPSESAIIKAMQSSRRPLLLRELYHILHIRPEDRKAFRALVKKLVKTGRLIHIKGRRYGLAEQMQLVSGRLRIHPDGYGLVEPEEKRDPVVYIPANRLKGVMDGDLVVARIEHPKGHKKIGTIIRILERKKKYIIGLFYQSKRRNTVIPEDDRIPFEILIPPDKTKGAETGEMVVAEIMEFSPGRRIPEGRIIDVLGDPDDLDTQLKAVIYKYELPNKWKKQIKDELKELPDDIRPEDLIDRKDLTNLPFITIDGENARDFDDAIYVRRLPNGFRLYVAIADVAHYVRPGTALDKEAYTRGTSIYFPNAVIPMFPERLSNNLCSLNPHVKRLAITVIMNFDYDGRRHRTNFFKAVIKSHERLTYNLVQKLVVDKDPYLRRKYKRIIHSLDNAVELCRILRKRRLAKGSIDFDLPEPEVILDPQGRPEEIIRRERYFSHLIIEEFMIVANEAVAEFLTNKDCPILYRIHEAPDPLKLKEFAEFANSMGLEIEPISKPTPSWFQDIIKMVEDKPYAYLINVLLLRSLKQAKYSPEHIGHFGLASECYCHFTSPIRRYPDLIIHRALKAVLEEKRQPYKWNQLEEMGRYLSERERVAMEAEREMLDRICVRFIRDHIGKEFDGVISGVTAFGFFVELFEIYASGVVRLADLPDDYYFLDEKNHRLIGRHTGKTFRIGDLVRVRVKEINLCRRHINFELVKKL